MSDRTPRTDEHLRMKKENGHVAIIAQEFARQLESELAEAQNENNVLKAVLWYYCTQRGTDVIEELYEKVKRLESIILTIQAWDIDKRELRGHHCLAKQWICSLQDQIKRYKKGKQTMSERPDSSKYKGDGSLSDFHCDTDDYIDKIENELAEARAEIGRLKISLATESMRADGITIANDALESNISERDELIEHMRRTLEYALTKVWSKECERLIKATLSAAGMGGK